MSRKPPPSDDLFDQVFKTVLLHSESPRKFRAFRAEIFAEIHPRTPIERVLTRQLVNAIWESERLQSLAAGIINNAKVAALQNLIEPTSQIGGVDTDLLAKSFYSDDGVRPLVLERLAQLGLSEADVETEAYRLRAEELQSLNRLVVSAQSNWIKKLRALQAYRAQASLLTRSEDEIRAREIEGTESTGGA
ncbi:MULTISPECIES: hypothetical protein [unclassified Bradyrhizobium]|uniref:hypothetical protein n=1 Tax=unclassified Bradyrhizobium TaxID=2631580 RepID=UPI001FFBCD22|nr:MULTISPECIES: hypothetical protein [unclassified Bradyrhizobium]MCK1538195.1 hypothetical protein [Bradyrhizobium sp. 176]MCK1562387.1 hypothetical protein [Bradyrhizobium sp. 171]